MARNFPSSVPVLSSSLFSSLSEFLLLQMSWTFLLDNSSSPSIKAWEGMGVGFFSSGPITPHFLVP